MMAIKAFDFKSFIHMFSGALIFLMNMSAPLTIVYTNNFRPRYRLYNNVTNLEHITDGHGCIT